jgi:DNA polymerase III epsilon subunit-like protein
MILVFDTETTGLPANWKLPISDVDNWPRIVQMAWLQLGTELLDDCTQRCAVIYPDGFAIPEKASAVHGITDAVARETGEPLGEVLADFCRAVLAADKIVCHNTAFDMAVVAAELWRLNRRPTAIDLLHKPVYCTMQKGIQICKIPGMYGYKWPTLAELYRQLFGREPANQHRADGDVRATAECYVEMVARGYAG